MNNNLTEKLLKRDSLSNVEKIVGKHCNDFSDEEQMLALGTFIIDNKIKTNHLKSIGDTYWGITWSDFKNLLNKYGFKEGLKYNFETIPYFKNDKISNEEAIIYYHDKKGLIIFATSYYGMTSVNEGNLYGEIKINKEIEKELYNVLDCSHGAFGIYDRETKESTLKNSVDFSCDVREGLIYRLNCIEEVAEFCSVWEEDRFLWFVDYVETKQKDYNHKEITRNKIEKCPQEIRNIINNKYYK